MGLNIHCVQERGYNLIAQDRAPSDKPAMEFIYCPSGWIEGFSDLTKALAKRMGFKIVITSRSSKTNPEGMWIADFHALIVDGSLDEFVTHWKLLLANGEPLPPVVFVITDFDQLGEAVGIERVWAAAPYTAEELSVMLPTLDAEYLLEWTGGCPELIDVLVAQHLFTQDEIENYFWDWEQTKGSWLKSGSKFRNKNGGAELWKQWLSTGCVLPKKLSAEMIAHGWLVKKPDGGWRLPRAQRIWGQRVNLN